MRKVDGIPAKWSLGEEIGEVLLWTGCPGGGILESMILLNELAQTVLDEVRAWPMPRYAGADIHVRPSLDDVREGDQRALAEFLLLVFGRWSSGEDGGRLEIGGDDSVLTLRFSGEDEGFWDAFMQKAASWKPSIQREKGILTLSIPAPKSRCPVDLEAMARESGIEHSEALDVLTGFLEYGRSHLDVLVQRHEENRTGLPTAHAEAVRAAHSLKGAGRTLQAPHLAAAAAALERTLKRGEWHVKQLIRLQEAWNEIETWAQGASV